MKWLSDGHEREMDEEIRFHLEMETEKNRQAGMSEREARDTARQSFGGVRRTQEEIRDLRRTQPLEMFLRDLAYGWRTLRRAPAYALTTIITLGLAVGACAAVLTFIQAALLQPLPYDDPDRIVTIWETNLTAGETQLAVSPANFLDWQEMATAFESLGLASASGVDIRRGDRVVAFPAGRVSRNYFTTLGITPIAGRLFEESDYDPGAEPRVILSNRFWLESFGGDRSLVGSTIEMDGRATVVLGVVPDHVDHASRREAYIPLFLYGGESRSRTGHWMHAVGRLKPGLSIEEAAADLDRVAGILAREHPETNEPLRTRLIPLREAILGPTERLLGAFAAGSGCLLLLACANIAALALARGASRRRELAIRVSLGAGTGRIVRQLATESALLNAAGAIVAWAVATGVIVWVASNAPEGLRRLDDARAGAFTLGAVLLTTVLSTLLSGVLPALRLARSGLARDLESSRRDSGLTRSEARLQSVLVVTQIALALLLLTGAGLLIRSLQRLTANDLGFDPHQVATIQMYLYDLHPEPGERSAFVRSSLDAIRALPGVTAAGATTALPFSPATEARADFAIVGQPPRAGESLTVKTTAITPGYLETMDIPVVQGRDFTGNDDDGSMRVALISSTAAGRFWDGSPLGSRIRVGIMGPPQEWTVVGVVADTRSSDYAQPPAPEIFVPVAQGGPRVGGLNYVARGPVAPQQLLETMQETIWSLTPSQSIAEAELMARLVGRTLQTRRFALLMISGFGSVALLLSAMGLFGLLSYVAARRRIEVGVRMALGATPAGIRQLFLRRGLVLTTIGIAVGMILSAGFARALQSFLYETSPFDPAAIAAVVVMTLGVALLASWIPARRIAMLDPGTVLRSE